MGAGSRFALDAVPASWTIEGEEDGCVRRLPAGRVRHLDLRVLRCGPERAGRAFPKAEADATAGPGAALRAALIPIE